MNSFTNRLPWSYCRPEWEQENVLRNITCLASASTQATDKNSLSSSELYFRREVLKEKESIIDGIGYPDWKLTLCLGSAWLISFIIMRKGIKSSGRASYFLALFPYIILFTLLIRAVTLDGSSNGIFYFINPNWTKIVDPQVWYSAATQCFFSLNVGFGNIISYASYNSFTHNIYRDSVIISVIDTFTSLIAGFTIFGILGNLAFKLNVNVNEVINAGGTGLAFISYPEAIARFDTVPWTLQTTKSPL
ncbi:Sodium:neurotransmitter symporter family [Popillia japonica]|uniref:Sodium-dependent nutrient amino acid transporter 1 n=1 Tax=Popillia japonica TaxID=7064 RepID=A0AAW1L823_POPJA